MAARVHTASVLLGAGVLTIWVCVLLAPPVGALATGLVALRHTVVARDVRDRS